MALDCTARLGRLTSAMDDAEAKKFDPLKGKTGITPDSFWRTVNGHALQEVGPGSPELNVNDYISLFSRVGGYGKAGAELSDKIRRGLEFVEINSGIYTQRALQFLTPLKSEAEWINLREVIEQRSGKGLAPGDKKPDVGSSKITPLNGNVARAVEFLNSEEGSGGLLDQLAGIAERDGLIQGRLKNYWPIIYPTKMLEDLDFKNRAMQSFAREQARLRIANEKGIKPGAVVLKDGDVKPVDFENAQLVFDRYVIPQYAAVAPHLELKREWDVAGQIDDPQVLIPIYIKQMWRRIGEKRIFGERDHLHDFPVSAKTLLADIQSTHGKAAHDEALLLVKDFVGISPADPTMNSMVMRTLSNIQGLKLTMSALRNAGQQINTVMRGDAASLFTAWGKYINDGQLNGYNVRELAQDIGSAADLALYDSTLYRGHDMFGRVVEQTLHYTGFTPIERLNRILTGIAGSVYADKQVRRFLNGSKSAGERLKELGISLDKVRDAGGIDHTDMLLAGRRFIDETQFRTRPGDLPFFAQSPLWRFLLQFRTFSINQTRFMVREIQRRPARVGLFALAVMPGVGFTTELAYDAALELLPWVEPRRHDKRGELEMYLNSWAAAGSLGLVSDLAWGTYMAGESKALSNFFTPPGIGTLNDMVAIAGEVGRGKGNQAARDFFTQFGGLGAAFGRYQFPPKSRHGQRSTLDEVDEWLDF